MHKLHAVALTLALTTVVPSAAAQLATFDDLPDCRPTNTGGTPIPNGYQGFDWSNFYVAHGANTASAQGGPGYASGTVTNPCIALNGFGAGSAISSATPFIFNGGFFTAAFDDGLSLEVRGFSGVTQLFSQILTLSTSAPQLMDVNWAGLTQVTFASGTGNPGSQFVFDNFRFNNTPDPNIPSVAPEPGTLLLLGSGLAGLAGMRWRRRRRDEVSA